ncbi:hypothetical protein [Intestinibacter sp.]|uniref:hypothetical protein n=1 Tax=Intestinibacter sp. TaxID=1965304 RepID=UPI002A74E330|nr:hypothetical protein [Intestinibacter sp.]MDY2737147.1 hypothetical protein [Intestinibacter sp.]
MKKLLTMVLGLILCMSLVGCGGDNSSDTSATEGEYTIKHGEFIESHETDDNGIVIKVKIEPNATNKLTIDQNGYNVEDLIKNQGCDKFDKIDYWAVADMEDGSESKVVSFTIDSKVIQGIKDGNIVANEIIDTYADDVYILPSLQEK